MKSEYQNGRKCDVFRFFAFYGSTVGDTQNFARDVIYREENLLQNGFSPESPFLVAIAKIELEKLQIPFFVFLSKMVLDTRKLKRTNFIRHEIYP